MFAKHLKDPVIVDQDEKVVGLTDTLGGNQQAWFLTEEEKMLLKWLKILTRKKKLSLVQIIRVPHS